MKGFAAVLLALAAFSVDGFIGRRAHMVEQRRSVRNAAQRFQVRASAATEEEVDVEPAVAAEVVDYSSPRFLKSTKQVATVGPSSNTYEMLKKLYLAGVDVFRLNFSHGSHEEKSGLVDTMRKLEAELGRPVCILADLQGPKHRVGMYPEGDGSKVALTKGQTYRFDLDGDSPGDGDRVSLPHPDVMAALEVGHRVLIDDGKLTVVVTKKGDGFVETEVMNDAIISSRKGFNLPDTEVKSSPLTPKDRSDLEFIVKNLDVDWVALSFVQSPDDIVELRSLADEAAAPRKAKVKFMAKLEKPGAVQGYLDSIVQLCDGIMVARGDLGVEMEIESVPITQRRIIDRCQEYGKPVIVATQMLESMIESPSPTRAEVSDVATAVFDGADAVMLSAESAAGKYPVEAVTMQQKIISTAEKDAQYRERINRLRSTRSRSMTTTDAITGAARVVAEQVGAKAIVVLTKSGTTVARASRERAAVPVIAATTLSETARYLQLSWGVDAILIDQADFTDFDVVLNLIVDSCKKRGILTAPTDLLVVTAGFPFGLPGVVNDLRVVSAAGPGSWDMSLTNPTK